MVEKKKKGPQPKYGETMTTAIKISLTEKLEKDLGQRAIENGYTNPGGTVDYVRTLIINDLQKSTAGAATFPPKGLNNNG